MSYELKIKGFRDPMRCEDTANVETARQAWIDFQTGSRADGVVELGNWTGMLSDINGFVKLEGGATDTDTSLFDTASLAERVTALNEPPHVRSRRTGFFEIIFWTFMGRKPNVEELARAMLLQEEFYTKNPRRTIPDPQLFRGDLIPGSTAGNAMGLRIISNVLSNELRSQSGQ